MDADKVFKALGDPTRRKLLDLLYEHNGQTLGQLSEQLDMARQSATQHLGVLEAANLITTVRRGREKLHYLNPVPLHEIQERWIDRFERPRLRVLSAVKAQAEEAAMADIPSYVYVTYIHASPEQVWHALTDADLTAEYWGHRNVSDWQPGSSWQHVRTDGSEISDIDGEVLEADRPRRLAITFGEGTHVTFTIEPHEEIVRLTVLHENIPSQKDYEALSGGWPAVMANLKSLLETGKALPQAPWEMDYSSSSSS